MPTKATPEPSWTGRAGRKSPSVLEGMIIGAFAIGADEGYVYVREEYPLAVENINVAIEQAEEYGFWEKIFWFGLCFKVIVHQGAGAFVCGESTALMASLEGKVGEPRAKYTRPTSRALGKDPASEQCRNLGQCPDYFKTGAEWFTQCGTEGAKGQKSSPWLERLTIPGWWKCPWASP